MNHQAEGAAAKAVSANNESKKEFIARAAHDLREPLRAIRLGARMLLAEPSGGAKDNAAAAHYLSEGTDRLDTLIQDIAAYCYEEVCESDATRTDLNIVLFEARAELAEEIKKSGATLTYDSLPTVLGNPASLATLWRALISNACKFHSDAAPHIHVAVQREGPEWVFSVKDNGLGFDPTYRERIFRPFERLHGKGYPGSGLGLTIARKIVERHGGRLWVESAPGAGSTFWFSLPLLS